MMTQLTVGVCSAAFHVVVILTFVIYSVGIPANIRDEGLVVV